MRTTHVGVHRPRKQIRVEDSWAETNRRLNAIQSDLIGIVSAIGFSRSLLHRRGPWDEACRNPKEYEPHRPYLKEDEMIVDVVRTVANRGNEEEQNAVRKAVRQYFETRCNLALEWLGEESDSDVLALTLLTDREECLARGAVTSALTSQSPESFERAAREEIRVLSLAEQLAEVCMKTAVKLRLTRGPSLRVAP